MVTYLELFTYTLVIIAVVSVCIAFSGLRRKNK